MSAENPYFHRGPIKKPEHFFDRAQEVTNALNLLKNNQSVSIVGPRRIGKTSFLLHISHPEMMAQHGLSPDEHIFVFIDSGGLSDLDQVGFYRLILEETEDKLLDRGLEVELRLPETLTYRQFERALRRLNRQGFKLIYLFDEFELISENHNLDADFFSGLRGLAARYDICYVTASQAHLLELTYAEGVLGSPFFNIFAVQYLALFSQAEALRLIHEPSQAAGVTFSEAMAGFILDLVGPQPLFLNIACFHAFAWLQRPPSPALPLQGGGGSALSPTSLPEEESDGTEAGREQLHREQIQQKVLEEVEGHLHYYWGKLDGPEKETLASLGQTGQGDTTQVMIRRLEQQGLVVKAGGGYRCSSTALADFVGRQVAEEGAGGIEADRRPLEGRRLGRYLITEQVGQGGMARVYKGRHEALQRDVAIKILFAHLADDEDFLERFRREAQAVAALRHPHIVQVHDFGARDGLYYMVMEYVTGGTLKDRQAKLGSEGGVVPLAEAVRIVREVAAALDYAHAQGIVHRDLKPANIMLTAAGQVVLTDFGLARIMGGARHTATGASWGTPAYMSPEQAQGEQSDERSDIYSLGVILYELVTGRVPFDADTPFGLIVKQMSEPAPPPCSLNPDLPEAVEAVILRTLAKEPAARHATAGALAEALARACDGDGQ